MFDYFRGLITDKKRTSKGTFITIEVQGTGYLLEITENDFMQVAVDESNAQKIYVLLTHREDAMTLYGFTNKETRDIFQILLSVSGVGAKMAQKIILELKDRLIKTELPRSSTNMPKTQAIDDTQAVLLSLGYEDKEIEDALKKVMPTIEDAANSEEVLRKALTCLSM